MHDELNNDEFWEHGGRDGYGVPREGVRPRDLGREQGMGDQEYGNREDSMGNRGDRMGYRGDRMGNRANRFGERHDQDRGLNTIKVTLPKFKGSSDPDEFLEWKIQSERIFLTNNISETLKAKYALTQFEGYASTWWESKRRERESHHNYELPTWQELITLMELRYLTPNYYQEVLKKVFMLRQGIKSVEEYYDEFENLRMKSKIEENMQCTVIRFMANLRYDILKPLKLKHYETLEAAFHDGRCGFERRKVIQGQKFFHFHMGQR